MNVALYQVYGQRTASNPHARNWSQGPLLPKSAGNRAARSAARSNSRKLVAKMKAAISAAGAA